MKKYQNLRLIIAISLLLPTLGLFYFNLEKLIDLLLYTGLKLQPTSHWVASLHFFIYDTIKILILLFVISTLMGIVNTYFPIDRIRTTLTNKKMYGLQYLFASLFGALTPFCSCSSIPLFIGFVKGGIPLGITFSFLITSPLVNEVAVAMFLGLFGIKTTLIYAVSGILMGAFGGFILEFFKLEKHLSKWVRDMVANSQQDMVQWEEEKQPFIARLPHIIAEGWGIVKGVLLYVILGIAIGAVMHGYVPENFFSDYLSAERWYAIPVAVILAVPMYGNAAGIVPVVQVLVTKGVPLGTAIAFMMSVVGLSLPEASLLKKVMNWKLILIFFGTVTLCIILLGYFFNLILR